MLLLPAEAAAINLRSTLSVPALEIAPSGHTSARTRTAPFRIKGKTRSVAVDQDVRAHSADFSGSRKGPVVAATIHNFGQLARNWRSAERWGELTPSYARLAPADLAQLWRAGGRSESLSLASFIATEQVALGYSLTALEGDNSDDTALSMRLILTGRRFSRDRRGLEPSSPVARGTKLLGDLARRCTVALRGDARGLRATDAGDVSWDLVGSIGRTVGPADRLELQLGYRVSRLDDRRTQGFTGIDRFIQGPQLGFTLGI